MASPVNRQLKLARRPEGRVSLDDFTFEEGVFVPLAVMQMGRGPFSDYGRGDLGTRDFGGELKK